MFGIGPQELILILVGALIIFGPQRLPEIASQVGKAVRDFRRMSDDLTGEFQRTMNLAEEQKPTPPALTSEVIPANSTPNGIGDAIASSLRVETVPTEEPPTGETFPSAVPEPSSPTDTTAAPQDMVISLAPIATKSEPLIGVSLLDEPTPYVGPKSTVQAEATEATQANSEAESTDTAIAAAASYVYEPTPVSDSAPAEATTEADTAQAQHSVNDAWDAVISTEATAPLPVVEAPFDTVVEEAIAVAPTPLYPAGTYSNESQPFPAPERERIDPEAEVTIREKIEAQVASEAFRERRRLAHYQRTRGKRSE